MQKIAPAKHYYLNGEWPKEEKKLSKRTLDRLIKSNISYIYLKWKQKHTQTNWIRIYDAKRKIMVLFAMCDLMLANLLLRNFSHLSQAASTHTLKQINTRAHSLERRCINTLIWQLYHTHTHAHICVLFLLNSFANLFLHSEAHSYTNRNPFA